MTFVSIWLAGWEKKRVDFIKMRGFALRSCLCLFLLLFLSKLNIDIIKHYTDKLATDKYIHNY